MDKKPRHRDLSQLSALLAAHSRPAEQSAPTKPTKAIAPANDNKQANDVLAWPTFERLAHRRDQARLYALMHWRNLMFPQHVLDGASEEDDLSAITKLEIRPSEGELLSAIGWKIVGRERWPVTGKSVNIYQPCDAVAVHRRNKNGGMDTQFGGLLFRDGALVEWGRTAKGNPLRPVERPRSDGAGSKSARSDARIWSYLKLRGAVASPLTATPYAPPISDKPALIPMLDPQEGTEDARSILRSLGIDGSVPFDQLPFPATRCADGLVAGPQWVGGVKKPKPAGETSAAAGREPELVRQVETISYAEYLRSRLGEHAIVLDLAITDATAKQIGIAMGNASAYAEKRGPALIDAALDALIDLDETARGTFVQEEEKIAA